MFMHLPLTPSITACTTMRAYTMPGSTTFHIIEPAEGERSELRKIEIEACFLGPFHDRRIFLSYKNVTGYSLQTSPDFTALPSLRTGHGDLLVHELRIHPSGDIIHEMEFSRGSIQLIRCNDLTHREELIR